MGKFSDPNYKLLKDYFDILVAERTGTDKSYLIGPNKTVVADGGLYTILYEDHPTRGYVGHRFIIDAITGNRFEMTYAGLESNFTIGVGASGSSLYTSTTSAELSAFGIGNDFYFRKDSFFHFWLARPTQDDAYHDYCNQEKTFLFFGKIWPNGTNKYSIEFEGLKDFTLKGLPEHNQTVNMTEWLKVYWDQIHHQMYSMTKHFWSMFDAREIDIRWLGYIAGIYGIEISEEILNEISLREWVENLPYFLKRIGTYNALYIVWKVFMQNTQNKLNVYERWGEWCTQTLDQTFGDVKDSFVDHHYLEFYGTQPSGGAGDWYYSQYNPATYPTHTLTAPVSCGTFSWRLGMAENFLATSYADLNCSVGLITGETIEITGYDPQRLTTSVIYLSGGNYNSDFTHSIGIEMDVATSGASNLVFWAMSNEVTQMSDHTGDYICLSYETSGGNNRYFKLTENEGGMSTSVKTTETYLANKPYYVIITRTGTTFSATIFDRERKWANDLVESISLTKSDVDTYSNLYVLNAKRIPSHGKWYGTVYALYTQDISYTRTVGASGNPVITPHYKVQIDLSTEPLGDIFDDATIISENVITELYRNFEYVRPVNKYAHYEELIAPLAQVDRVGDSIPLYSRLSNGFFNTFFTGSRYLSAGGSTGKGGENTTSYFQQFASKTWTVNHELVNGEYLLVQPWVFTGTTADNSQMIIPESIHIVDNNTVQITFNESYRGIVSIAGTVATSGITYTADISASPSAFWGLRHNLDTDTPTGSAGVGYFSPPGPVAMYWNTDGYRIMPEIHDMLTDNRLDSTWDSHGVASDGASGSALIRRSDYVHNQYDASTIWNIPHNLNSFVIAQFYRTDPSPENDREFFPRIVKSVDENNIQAIWDSAVRGFAHIVQVPRERVVYSPYTCDEFGLGMCVDVLGYWKVGTGESAVWNPFIENDLETPVASGTFYKIEDDLNNIYIDFIVPENVDPIDIKEVGLFNYADDMILYSRSSGLYKPDGVQTYFHYRIVKLGSSSSSSVSSSSSSSESSSSSSSSSSISSSSESSSSSSSSESLYLTCPEPAFNITPWNAQAANASDRTWRCVISNSELRGSGSTIRVEIASYLADFNVQEMWIGKASGVNQDFDGSQVQVTFHSGSVSASVLATESLWSDEIAFDYNGDDDLIISTYFPITNAQIPRKGFTGCNTYYVAGNSAGNTNSNGSLYFADLIVITPSVCITTYSSSSSSSSESSSSSSSSTSNCCLNTSPSGLGAYYTPDASYRTGGSQNLRASIPSTLINQNGSLIRLVFERPPGSSFGVACSDVWCGAAIASGSTTFDGTQQAVFFNGSRSLTIPLSAGVGGQVISDPIVIDFTDIDFIVSFLTSSTSDLSVSDSQPGAEMRSYYVPFANFDPSVSASIPQSESGDPNFSQLGSRSDQVIGITAICVGSYSSSSSSTSNSSSSSSSWTPNDDFESYIQGDIPSGGRWLAKVNDAKDRITNVPTISAGTVIWSNVYSSGTLLYDEQYMFTSNWELPTFTNTPGVTAFEFSLTILGADKWSATGQVNSYGSQFYFGFNEDNTADFPGIGVYIGVVARGFTPSVLYAKRTIGGVQYDAIELDTPGSSASHFPLVLKIRKEINPDNSSQFRKGCTYYNRVTEQWDAPGTPDANGWAWGGYETDKSLYPYFIFSQDPDVTYLNCEMRNVQVDDFEMLEGSIPSGYR